MPVMHLQIDMLDAQVNERPDGSVEVLGLSGYAVFKAEYAEKVKDSYKKLLQGGVNDTLKIAVNIEVPQPMGTFVNEG